MNSITKNISSKPLLSIWMLAAFSIALYLLSLIMSNFQIGEIGNAYSNNKLQSHIADIETSIVDINSKYLLKLDSSILNEEDVYLSQEFIDAASKCDIHAFVIVDNKLVAWTDNDFIINKPITNDGLSFYSNEIGSFIIRDIITNNYKIRYAYRLYQSYAVSNEYLQSGLNPSIGISNQVEIVVDNNAGNAIYSRDGGYLFSAIWKINNQISQATYGLIFAIFILSFLFFITFVYKVSTIYLDNNLLQLFTRLVIVIIATYIWQNLLLPQVLVFSPIFSSSTFASIYFDSLGCVLLQLLAVLFSAFAIGHFFESKIKNGIENKQRLIIYLISIIVFVLLLHFIKLIVSDLIFNSTISYNLSRISDITYLAIIGLFSIGVSIAIFIFVYVSINRLISNLGIWQQIYGVLLFLFIEISIVFITDTDYSILLFFIAISALNIVLLNIKTRIGGTSVITIFLLLFSLLIAYWFNEFNLQKERVSRKAIIQSLAINQDPQTEFLFTEISKKMYADEDLLAMFENQDINFDSLSEYIEIKYFKNHQHFKKYDFQTTICTKDLQLLIRPQNIEINCDTFFYRNLISFGKLTDNKNLYRLDYGTGQVNYLGVFRFYNVTEEYRQVFTVYMEINSKLKRKGFTRVLRAKEYDPFAKISKYALARYENGLRVEKYGKYTYPEHLPNRFIKENNLSFADYKDYSHLIYRLNDKVVYVLGLKNQPMFGRLAPFSYLFILFGILLGVLMFFYRIIEVKKDNINWSFGKRLQITMVAIILVSFAIISIITMLYIKDLNESKNRNQLTNLAVALQIEFEHKLSAESDLSKVDPDYLVSLLQKFAKVFDTDINIYQLNGKLLSSTRYEVFDRKLMSEYMNSQALQDLKQDHQSIYIDRENIGSLLFSSAYMPFHNSDGEIIAFLNLPHFAREEVLKSEISSLLMALMNVYILIIVVAILTILFVSKYISRPLIMLKEKLQLVSIGKQNSKIKWNGIEEIEALVTEYNRMIDALELSSEKLAKSERETAWREMAKQVAHEIKNPLTPMKLSVQYMVHSFDENASNNREKLETLANTLVEQIDSLTDIATAFSDFANMPKSTKELNYMKSIIDTSVKIHSDYANVSINVVVENDIELYIDKNQWLRVFNNLLKNSIQAAIPNKTLLINIKVESDDDFAIITFSDNGCGIDKETREKIFVPNFTTKTKGSGLGLAMVKNIVTNSDGIISFESEEGNGAIFTIKLKKYNGKNS